MKQVNCRKLTAIVFYLSYIFLFINSYSLFAQEGDPKKGKSIFNTNCAACHKLDKPMTGPALRNVENRLAIDEGLDRAWLNKWISNSAGLIASGDSYASKIFEEYKQSQMTAFPQLSEQDISDILAYTAEPKPEPPIVNTKEDVATSTGGGVSSKVLMGALALLFGLLAVALVLVRKTLHRFAKEKGLTPENSPVKTTLWKAYFKNQFLVLVTVIVFLLASAYFMFGYFMQVGLDQNYEPIQPIHYSHRIHAGDNEIDCKYCHSAARVSKNSGIPSLNVCMNCHKTISEVAPETLAEGQDYGVDYNKEIQKLYKAVGWDEASQSYTGETQAVKWVRVHNLPAFAYFNHSQHVTVAGIECQTCHGPVEEMEILRQDQPLTMGWCINCHKDTKVKIKDNAYYAKIHEQLSKKYGVEKLTVAEMGGIECGKCHY